MKILKNSLFKEGSFVYLIIKYLAGPRFDEEIHEKLILCETRLNKLFRRDIKTQYMETHSNKELIDIRSTKPLQKHQRFDMSTTCKG